MKKYFAFLTSTVKQEFKNLTNILSTAFSFTIHILILSCLWEFVLEGKALKGYTKFDLIWYVIVAEAITYSFNYYYKKIAYKIEMGDFAYEMSKPYNFLLRIFSEGIAELPMTLTICIVGAILGIILAGPITMSVLQALQVVIIILLALAVSLCMHICVGTLSIWIGKDVSSIWLLVGKMMLIFAFTPLELFPDWLQIPLLLLPTTHVIYTPSRLFVHFSQEIFVQSLFFEMASLGVMAIILTILYKKGVKRINVSGI